MPYKSKADKLLWQRANAERTRVYKEKWRKGPTGAAYLEKLRKQVKPAKPKKPKAIKRSSYSAESRKRQRLLAIYALGGKCIKCGNSDERVLEFDHISPLLRRSTGRKHQKDNARTVSKILRGLDDHGLQLLCANCHRIKTREGKEWALRFGLRYQCEDQFEEQGDLFD